MNAFNAVSVKKFYLADDTSTSWLKTCTFNKLFNFVSHIE